ncbi:hypothetical protein BXZ70DRAFT_485509 [Cristinia sonorae]|uniref:F-box domain-containing protein n=1 Tax=Cristinia sonorae TaxID=1940300 RepID=A0A8K0XLN0_9AGAR|nr:hypothetical protein BXZ70DRAFT_485509 [Cristinia sonorae]
MSRLETQWDPPFDAPHLPIEIWESIIDVLAADPARTEEDEALNAHLLECSLVCRAWVPRCRYHLCNKVTLRSVDGLTSLIRYLTSSPDFPARVYSLCIAANGYYDEDQSWISQVPVRVPRLQNLRELELSYVDLRDQNVQFWKFLTLMSADRLRLRRVNYSLHSQLSRIVAAVQPVSLSFDQVWFVEDSIPGRPLLSCGTRFHRLETVEGSFDKWTSILDLVEGWTISGPSLSSVQFTDRASVADPSELWEDQFPNKTIWRGVSDMFQSPCCDSDSDGPLPAKVAVETGWEGSVRLLRTTPTTTTASERRRKLELEFRWDVPDYIGLVLPLISHCQFHEIVLMTDPVTSETSQPHHRFHAFDENLSHPSLATEDGKVRVIPAEETDSQYYKDRCPAEMILRVFPTCAARGILEVRCHDWECGVHPV